MLAASPIDFSLKQEYIRSYADSSISRNELINILRAANDNQTIDQQEFIDLKNIIAQSNMPESVKYFANCIVNGSAANQFIAGQPLGNLFAGASSAHMNSLINKWLLGKDYPGISQWKNNTRYEYTSGALFINEPTISDVDQGSLADCYLINALGAVAYSNPMAIKQMFLYNGDDTWTLRFFDHRNGSRHYVTVDRYLPVNISSGKARFASFDNTFNNPRNELWVALAEKGYTQCVTQVPGLRPQVLNDYSNINYGANKAVSYQLIGISPNGVKMNSQQSILTSLSQKNPLLITINNHAYTIYAYNTQTQKFIFNNPWGHSHLELSWSQIMISGLSNKTAWQINARMYRSYT